MASQIELLTAAFADRYMIIRELGRGGMAAVYLADDLKNHRRVAIKVLHQELAHCVGGERFLREIDVTAAFDHPHIVPLLDSGMSDGFLYYVMPYVEGESLRERLSREKQLSVEDALRISREILDALTYAHSHNVLHRDIKPENILLADGHARVADFGIARALSAAGTERMTETGVAVGSPVYMSPEQATAERGVDVRSDVYSVGCVVYEMLAGQPPFTGRTPAAILARKILDDVPSLRVVRDQVPEEIERAIGKALAKVPADRFATVHEFAEVLGAAYGGSSLSRRERARKNSRRRAIVAGIATVGVLIVAASALFKARGALPERPVLVVLPFDNLGPPADAYFADGLTDEVRGRLAGIAGLRVIGGTSARQYKGTTKTPREIARELGATHLLTASVRWDRTPGGGGRVRVSPELVRAADLASVWGEPVEGPLDDIFALQARVAERVAAALDVALLAPERRALLPAPPTQNPAAYDAYLHGLAYAVEKFRFAAPAERRAASAAFQQAIALDSTFAAAHARLAEVYLNEWTYGRHTGMRERARASAARAMALDSTRLESRLAQASVLEASANPAEALRALQAAARLAPSSAEVDYELGNVYEMLGHPEDAVLSLRRAAALEPRWSTPVGELASAYDQMFRYAEAIGAREREIALSTTTPAAFARLGQAGSYLLWRADTAAARRQLSPDDPRPVLDLAIRMPGPLVGRAIWLGLVPPTVLAAKDTMTLPGYLRDDWATPDMFQLMKARHFWLTRRRDRARAHADSLIALLQPVMRLGSEDVTEPSLFAAPAVLAEAYAYAGRPADAARTIDEHVEQRRRGPAPNWNINLPLALVNAAYVDVLIGRRDVAVARLAEALRLPTGGTWISRALLRADPSWAPLRGHPGFERLIAGSP